VVSSVVDQVGIAACHRQIDSLRETLTQLRTRKDNLLLMQRRLSDFESSQHNQAEAFASSFRDVRFASNLASRLRETAAGPSFIAADAQVSTAVRKVYAEIDDTEDQLRVAQRHLAILQEGS